VKIAYLGPTGVFGGVRAIVEHLNGLAARGHDCTLISTTDAPVTWLPCRFDQRPQADPGTGYDVVVGTAIPTWPQAVALAGDGRPFGLLQMADWLFSAKGSPEQRAMFEAFTTPVEVLAISEWLAKLAEAASHTTYRIRNGIDPRLFFPDPFPDVPAFDGVTVVTEGYSHNPAKDVDEYTKRAIRKLRWEEGRAIRAIGFSQYAQTFEFDAYWQNPAQDLIRKIYTAGDIFLKASKYEGRPGPDLEAMACGAVVCRAIGAGDDDLHHGENCLKVPYGDYDGFVDNLRLLCDDANLRLTLRENGLRYVKEYADWSGAIDLVEQALTGAVTVPTAPTVDYSYSLDTYNDMQREIVGWETPQAMWLGETLAELLRPESVIDIGCGPGIYLTPFKPDARVLGVDGAPEAGQALEPEEFIRADLREDWSTPLVPVVVEQPEGAHAPLYFDLALCIETAEHLPPDRADYLVGLLAGCAETVFFSAAQPGQGGTLHFNEQLPEYWLAKFREHGFDLHPKYPWLAEQIAANPHCRRVKWLVGNAFLVTRVKHATNPN
jgi:SAM-dependent methyltransferase